MEVATSPQPYSPAYRGDDVANILSGLGLADRSRSAYTSVTRRAPLTCADLDAILEQRGTGALVSQRPADDMTREGYSVEDAKGAPLADLGSALEDLQVSACTRALFEQGSHYGGAVLLACVEDGMLPAEPLDLRRIEHIHAFKVLDRYALAPVRLMAGPPEAYMINTVDLDIPLEGRVFHESRCIKFNGPINIPARRHAMRDYWGVPTLERVWSELRAVWTAYGYSEEMLHDLSVDVFSIPKLHEAVTKGRAEEIKERVRLSSRLKSLLRALILDGGNPETGRPAEVLGEHTRTTTGVAEILNLFIQAWVVATGIPRSILLGETVGGLNTGTNSGEHRAWNARVKAMQVSILTPWLNWILEIVFASRSGPTGGNRPDTWTIRHHDLMTPTADERSSTQQKNADTASKLHTIGAISAREVRATLREEGYWKLGPELDAPRPKPAPGEAGAEGEPDKDPFDDVEPEPAEEGEDPFAAQGGSA